MKGLAHAAISLMDKATKKFANIGLKSDGSTYGLHVISEPSGGVAGNNPCPVLTSKYRIDSNFSDISLNPVGGSYTTLYSYSGSGKFVSAVLDFDNDNVLVRVEVDGEEIFIINCAELDGGLLSLDAVNSDLTWDTADNLLTFKPTCPIAYDTEVIIQAKSSDGSSTRDNEAYVISLTKET